MPIYEFVCNDCSNKFEEIVFGVAKNIKCPKCKGENTKKIMSVCRAKIGGEGSSFNNVSMSGSSGCSGCSGGNCSTCGG